VWSGSQIFRYGLVEGPLILSVIFFLLAADYLALGVAVVLLLVQATNIPAATDADRFVEEQTAVSDDPRRTGVI
jgi:hypothetical protein